MRRGRPNAHAQQLTLCDLPSEPRPSITKAEKNLIAIGFFSPSSKAARLSKSKTVTFSREIDGRRIEASVTIAPSAIHGLPMTADQDKYLAFQRIVSDIRRETGSIQNPVSFTSRQMLQMLGIQDAGDRYDEVLDWLRRMTATTIESTMAVYRAKSRQYQTDVFHVFDRVVLAGAELPDGTVADRNYVWLSDWQLENISCSHLLTLAFDRYRRLRNNIAKALVPHLRIWLYAARKDHAFEKRYDELCQLLNITEYTNRSRIVEQLGPSLAELVEHEYLAKWEIAKTRERRGFKLLLYDAERFRRGNDDPIDVSSADRPPVQAALPAVPNEPTAPTAVHPQEELIAALMKRGVSRKVATDLLAHIQPDQPVLEQLDYCDYVIAQNAGRHNEIRNPAGFCVHVIRDNGVVTNGVPTGARQRKSEHRLLVERYLQEIDRVGEGPASSAAEQLWWRIIGEIERAKSMSAHSIATWLRPTVAIRTHNGKLDVTVPFGADGFGWVRKAYGAKVNEAAHRVQPGLCVDWINGADRRKELALERFGQWATAQGLTDKQRQACERALHEAIGS